MNRLRLFVWCLVLGFMVPANSVFAEAPKKKAPLAIFENKPLVFGTVLAIRGPSQIILHPNGQREIIGDLDMKPNDVYGPGRLSITGERNTQVLLFFDPKVPLRPVQSQDQNTTPAKAENFVLFSNKISKISEVARLNYFGIDTLFIGARLSLSPESAVGTYTFTLSPTLDYRGVDNNPITPR